jgi:ABC-2 type transport system permease protein
VKKTLLVLRQEVINSLKRRSFQLTAFGIPLFSVMFFLAVSAINRSAPGVVTGILNPVQPSKSAPEGYVDESGLLQLFPEDFSPDSLQAYDDEGAAKSALFSGEIRSYYLIPEDYIETGQVVYVSGGFNPLDVIQQGSLINRLLRFNLLNGDVQLVNMVAAPFSLQLRVINPTRNTNDDTPMGFFLPYAVMLLYYMLILMSAGFLVSSLNKERENRVLEIMMVTITPRQLLVGKFIGLGLMGLLVNFFWVGTGFILMRAGGATFQLPAEYQIPAHILVWGLVYFLLGYAVYASLLGAVGAMLPNLRETSQATIFMIIPMMIPLMFVGILVERPNGILAVGMSLFPLTAPVTMMMRLIVTDVPVWQLLLSVLLMLVAAVIIMRSVARMFQARTMLTGQPLSLKYIYRLISGRV